MAKGKRIDKGNKKMLLIRQREWHKQKGNDEKQKGNEKTAHITAKDHENLPLAFRRKRHSILHRHFLPHVI